MSLRQMCALSVFPLLAGSLSAAVFTVNFGSGANVSSSWAGTSNASASTIGVALTNPILMVSGALQMVGNGGSAFCAQGLVPGTCGTSTGLSTATAYGLGVANGRVDGSETLTLTVNPGYTASILGFALTGFNGTEAAVVTINGTPTTFNAPGVNVALDSFSINGGLGLPITSSVVWSIPVGNTGNYSLATITVDVNAVPEPSTVGTVGIAALGMLMAIRRQIRS